MHKITKSYLTNLVDQGLTVEQIAARITKDFNEPISLNLVRAGLKLFKLQTRRNKFAFVDDTKDIPSGYTIPEMEEASSDYNPHDDLSFSI